MLNKIENTCNTDFLDLTGIRILLIDDDPTMQNVIGTILKNAGSLFSCAKSFKETKAIASKQIFDIALVDMVLSDSNGLEIINFFHTVYPTVSLIVITGYPDQNMAYSLENAGIQSVLTKPFLSKQLTFTLCKELARRKLLATPEGNQEKATEQQSIGLIGNSSYIKSLHERIRMFACSDIPVLIEGPTGTGKEIIATAIHRLSSRGNNSMMIVNSSAIPEYLEESEFFGHAKGAFTGAFEEKAGIIQCSNNSSLFLDEVGDLSLRMQAKLLRVLDGHGYTRIGDTRPHTSDFRLLSATNRPLRKLIEEGTFRQDLYFRLKSGIIETIPLCNHKEDIPILIRYFIREVNRNWKQVFEINDDALDVLIEYDWPGNIRELKNLVETLCTINVKTSIITLDSINMVMSTTLNGWITKPSTFSTAKTEFEMCYYTNLLAKHNGNITSSALEAQIDRPNFSKKLKSLGIHARDYKIRKKD